MDEYRMENVNANDIKRCLDHCQTVPGCGAVDYASGPKFCHMNDAIGMKFSFKQSCITDHNVNLIALLSYNYLIISLIFPWYGYGEFYIHRMY